MIQINNTSQKTYEALKHKHEEALQKVLADKSLGFHQLTTRDSLWDSCANAAKDFRQRFDTLVVLGIGGSALGGRVIKESLGLKADREVLFWDNIDPIQIDLSLKKLKSHLAKVGWAVVSKSGNTIETLTQSDYIAQFYKENGLDWTKQVIAITEPKENPLSLFAKKYQIPQLEVPLDVGGRFSVLTPVGMFPAAFMGLNIADIKSGASLALNSQDLITNFSTQSEQSFKRDEWITVFWTYSELLKTFGLWIQQLWAESLAKKEDLSHKPAPRASTPLPCVGATDQHSILQQIAEGQKDKFVVFIRSATSENGGSIIKESLFNNLYHMNNKKFGELLKAEAIATQQGLSKYEISNMTFSTPEMSEKLLGYLFMYFELVVATLGERMHINTFNQPGVEIGKIIAKDLLIKGL